MNTLLLPADAQSIAQAAELIKNGQLVGFPTETVYGLGADALNARAVLDIFAAKGRPADNPLIVHIAAWEELLPLCHVNDKARRLADAFWPGPLTMILPKKEIVPPEVTAGLDSVAIQAGFLATVGVLRGDGLDIAEYRLASLEDLPDPASADVDRLIASPDVLSRVTVTDTK